MDTTCQATISESSYTVTSLKSTLLGSQCSWPASVISNEDPRGNIFAEADASGNRRQGGMSMNTSLDHSLQYTEIHTTSDVSTLPVGVPDNSGLQTAAQFQERVSTEIPQQSQNSRKGPTAASPGSGSKRVKALPSEDPPKCGICGQYFAQSQGVTRHHREAHEPSPCQHCDDFKWSRRPQLKEHLKEQHPDIHLQKALKKATNCRRSETIAKNRQKGQQGLPLAIEYDLRSLGEHLPQRRTPPFSPEPEVAHVPSPDASSVASSYDAQSAFTLPILTPRPEFEHARELALFGAAYAYLAFPSSEECAPPGPPPNVPFLV